MAYPDHRNLYLVSQQLHLDGELYVESHDHTMLSEEDALLDLGYLLNNSGTAVTTFQERREDVNYAAPFRSLDAWLNSPVDAEDVEEFFDKTSHIQNASSSPASSSSKSSASAGAGLQSNQQSYLEGPFGDSSPTSSTQSELYMATAINSDSGNHSPASNQSSNSSDSPCTYLHHFAGDMSGYENHWQSHLPLHNSQSRCSSVASKGITQTSYTPQMQLPAHLSQPPHSRVSFPQHRVLLPRDAFSQQPTPFHPTNGSYIQREGDDSDFVRRCEDRKIRNRASAQASRQRKRLEQDRMRDEYRRMQIERGQLRMENGQLKERLGEVEKQKREMLEVACDTCKCKFLADHSGTKAVVNGSGMLRRGASGGKRAGACLLAVVGLMTLNWPVVDRGTLNNPSQLVSTQSVAPGFNKTLGPSESRGLPFRSEGWPSNSTFGKGRLLITAVEGIALSIANDTNYFPNRSGNTNEGNFTSMVNASGLWGLPCPSSGKAVNMTENIRLNNDLLNWIGRHERMNSVQLRNAGEIGGSSLLYPSPSLLLSQGYFSSLSYQGSFDHYDAAMAASPIYGGNGGGDGTKYKPLVGRKGFRSTWEKKEAARLKAVRDRAWRHLGMIPPTGKRAAAPADSEGMHHAAKLVNTSTSLNGSTTGNMSHSQSAGTADLPLGSGELTQLIAAIRQASSSASKHPSMLYVVALRDYFLLPSATNRSTTAEQVGQARNYENATMASQQYHNILPPPRVTLILPALSPEVGIGEDAGGRPKEGVPSLTMMRIECEVVGTGLLHLPDSVVPLLSGSLGQLPS